MILNIFYYKPQGRAGQQWVSHLKSGDGHVLGVVGGGHHMNQEGAMWDVLIIELDGNFVVA